MSDVRLIISHFLFFIPHLFYIWPCMKNLRAILMPVAILLGILIPQAHVLSPMMPFLIGTMMFLTFVTKIPPQTHGYTFKIEVRALVVSLLLVLVLAGIVKFFNLPREVLLGGAIIALCPPANAAPAMAKMLGGSASLALKIFLSGQGLFLLCHKVPVVIIFFDSLGIWIPYGSRCKSSGNFHEDFQHDSADY